MQFANEETAHFAAPTTVNRPLVIYHSNCLDGFTAAWAAWLRWPDAEFYPGVHGEPPPDVTGRKVYLLDFSYKHGVIEAMAGAASRIVILDHHASAEKDLADFVGDKDENVNCTFDMAKSGARLAWEWFHPGVKVPLFVRLVEDRDLWRFALPDSKALNALFFSYGYDFETWTELCDRCRYPVDFSQMIEEGKAIERKHMKDVRELVEKTKHLREFWRATPIPKPSPNFSSCGTLAWTEPLRVPCANLPYTMSSDAAGLMAETAPFAATYYYDGAQYVFSLRSRGEGGVDVSGIAALYGGGGHRNAAGFRVKSLGRGVDLRSIVCRVSVRNECRK